MQNSCYVIFWTICCISTESIYVLFHLFDMAIQKKLRNEAQEEKNMQIQLSNVLFFSWSLLQKYANRHLNAIEMWSKAFGLNGMNAFYELWEKNFDVQHFSAHHNTDEWFNAFAHSFS